MTKSVDIDKFHLLFDKHYASLCSLAYNYLKDESESKDVVQEVFIKVWSHKKELVDDPKAQYYLFTAVRNNCISLLRKKIHHLSVEDDGVLNKLEMENQDSEKHEFDTNQYIEKALSILPPKCAVIFKMSRLESMTYGEIAKDLDISLKTVENQMGKAIKLMREYLKKNPIPVAMMIVLMLLLSHF
ncbi:MAG: RNA polymerase sigma-70 factor [Prolixibacteraceae bacterium]|jgi:RNA polymerase sigma-70 factor (ECF subfamily)|nr:RNA polymerase sigma-70 factor [Prolixibacteraceae bacterium]